MSLQWRLLMMNSMFDTIKDIVDKILEKRTFTDMCWGTVTGVMPLTILVSNRLELSERSLILSQSVRETWINIPEHDNNEHEHIVLDHSTQPGGDGHTHIIKQFKTQTALPKIKLWRGLQTGDQVVLIKFANGQQYFVLERVEGVKNDAEQL